MTTTTSLPTTARRRHTKLDSIKFNAISIAIISAAALQFSPAFAQMTAPAKPAAPVAVSADADTAKYMEAFDRADKNKDGKLSKEEAENMPAIAQRFDAIDADKDGSISKNEYLDALKK